MYTYSKLYIRIFYPKLYVSAVNGSLQEHFSDEKYY